MRNFCWFFSKKIFSSTTISTLKNFQSDSFLEENTTNLHVQIQNQTSFDENSFSINLDAVEINKDYDDPEVFEFSKQTNKTAAFTIPPGLSYKILNLN